MLRLVKHPSEEQCVSLSQVRPPAQLVAQRGTDLLWHDQQAVACIAETLGVSSTENELLAQVCRCMSAPV